MTAAPARTGPIRVVSNMGRIRIVACVTGLTVLADQLTKWWAVSELATRSIDLFPTVGLRLTHNSGFSFGTGSGFGPVVGVAVLAITIALSVRVFRETNTRRLILLAAILGGAIGNLLDRLFRTDGWPLTGEVVDFVDVSWYAVFNLADAVLVVAVIVFIATEFVLSRRDDSGDATSMDKEASSPT